MDPQTPELGFRFNDPRQERIYRRLFLVGPGPAAMFRDACRIMGADPPFGSTTHLVGHLVRETESALRDVLEPLSGGTGGHSDEIRGALNYLGIDETDPIAQAWMSLVGLPHRWTHRDNLMHTRPVDEEFGEFWSRVQTIFDVVLDKLETRYLETVSLLDGLLAVSQPTQPHIDQFCKHAPHSPITLGYFFGKLGHAAWLEPLRANGYFERPPAPVLDENTGTVSFPRWAAAGYLARMAELKPQLVRDIALSMQHTGDRFVHADLADAALAMPAELARDFVPLAKTWIESLQPLMVGEKLDELVSKLARGKEIGAALDLARSLLAVFPDDGGLGPHARAHFDDWHYERFLASTLPDLCEAAPNETLQLLSDLLQQAVCHPQRSGLNDSPEDSSLIWRPAIEDHPQNPSHARGVRDLLVSAVRDVAETVLEGGHLEALRFIEGHNLKVFRRIGLHLRRVYPDADPDGTLRLLTDAEVFDDSHLHHEYFHLLREQFGEAPPGVRETYLTLVDSGPNWASGINVEQPSTEESQDGDEGRRHIRLWQFRKLWPIRNHLGGTWRARFGELLEEFGAPEHPGFLVYGHGVSWGPTSPRTSADLQQMNTDELFGFLTSPLLSDDLGMTSVEGVGRQLKEAVASDPSRFAAEIARFRELDPTFVRAVIEGLTETVKEKDILPWPSVLSFCQWVMHQPREIPNRHVERWEADADWGPTRLAVARLLSAALSGGDAELSFALRQHAWGVLAPLTNDPEPTPEYEDRYGGGNMDPCTLSINTVRGEAMHAVVGYALWVRRHVSAIRDGEERITQGFAAMPEVRKVLEDHLDPESDPSLAVRSVYGRWFPALVSLDTQWAAQNVPKVFPNADARSEFRDVAWKAYLTFNSLYGNVFPVLQEEYRRAVNRLGLARPHVSRLANPDERLAGHLMTLYWWGAVDFEARDGLVATFYRKAGDELRAQALAFVGRALRSTEEEIAPEILDRLQKLWRWRLDTARDAESPASHLEEIAAFGSWFVSGKFDDGWAMGQLAQALEVAPWAEPDHLVIERLAELAADLPLLAVRCLGMMAKGDSAGWHFAGWRQAPRQILATAMASSDAQARQAAIEEINRLGSRGRLEFRDLLQ